MNFAALLLVAALSEPGDVGGCFVHAFARTQFRPPATTYTGPRHEPIFLRDAGSLVVGPGARLEGYAGDGYRKRALDLPPGARVADLPALGFDQRVDSFRVVCTGVVSLKRDSQMLTSRLSPPD